MMMMMVFGDVCKMLPRCLESSFEFYETFEGGQENRERV